VPEARVVPGLDLGLCNRLLLEAAGVGLALVDPATLEVVFRNRRLNDWFPTPAAGAVKLPDLLEALPLEEACTALRERGTYTCELAVKVKRRQVSLIVRLHAEDHGDAPIWVLECQNNSKVKELEALIESYSTMIERQNRSLVREKERAEKLLLNIMPKTVYEELKSFGVTTPQRYDQATVVMLDFVGFTARAAEQDPSELIAELNDLFTNFDRIAEQFGCERIKTIGDAYMAVSGVPEPNPDHALNAARTALLIRRYLRQRNRTQRQSWECRIGIGTGAAIGSVVGVQKYVYDIFGPAVNLAARCEAISGPMEITVPDETERLIRADFLLEDAGVHDLKGLGQRSLFRLAGANDLAKRGLGLPQGLVPNF
jgi:adenylate cyclase